MLFAAGIGGGALSAMVGGASLITFPVMLAAGLPPVIAAASNIVASVPSSLVALYAERALMPPLSRSFVWFVVASVGGGLAGAGLLLVTSQRLFEILVPLLLGFATMLFALSGQISAWLRARAAARGRPELRVDATSIPLMLPVAIYGGYFGAGVGVMALAVLSLGTGGDYRSANVIKNLVMGINTIAVSAVFVIDGTVSWPPTLVMMAGTVFGGYLGVHLSRIIPPALMRLCVVGIGALLTIAFAWRYWI